MDQGAATWKLKTSLPKYFIVNSACQTVKVCQNSIKISLMCLYVNDHKELGDSNWREHQEVSNGDGERRTERGGEWRRWWRYYGMNGGKATS